MASQPLFAGLVVDEYDKPVAVAYVGDEPCYVVDDAGFRRHVPSEQVDRQVLQKMRDLIQGHEDLLAEQAGKVLGQEDPFSVAMLQSQLKNIDQQFDAVLKAGIPEAGRAYMGMIGFRVRINLHGEVLEVVQPGSAEPGEEEE
jgi:hypothetical protein